MEPWEIEMRAAQIAADYQTPMEVAAATPEDVSLGEYNGYIDRAHNADLQRYHEPDEAAGWLAHAIHAHELEQAGYLLDGIDQAKPADPATADLRDIEDGDHETTLVHEKFDVGGES